MTQKLYIPSIGDRIKLTKDWQFPVFVEYRNYQFLNAMRPDLYVSPLRRYCDESREGASLITLPAGTILTIRRIYIRGGAKDYDSVTFSIFKLPKSDLLAKANISKRNKLPGRANYFWVKLLDVNGLDFEHFEDEKDLAK